jgi:hypothetical protein
MKKIIRFAGLLGNHSYGEWICRRINMKHWRLLGLLVLTCFLAACATLQEQDYLKQYGSQGGRGQGFRVQPYQVDQEVHTCAPGKISGRITSLRVETFSQGMDPLLAAEVQTPDRGLVHVHLGPLWFLERHEADLKPGDEVAIQGFCYKLAGRETLLADEVVHKDQTLRLGDPQGNPWWEAWRKN